MSAALDALDAQLADGHPPDPALLRGALRELRELARKAPAPAAAAVPESAPTPAPAPATKAAPPAKAGKPAPSKRR